MTGMSIRLGGTRNRAVFLISRPDQRNGSRAFIPSVCCLLRQRFRPVGTVFEQEDLAWVDRCLHFPSVERPFAIPRCFPVGGQGCAIATRTGPRNRIQRFGQLHPRTAEAAFGCSDRYPDHS